MSNNEETGGSPAPSSSSSSNSNSNTANSKKSHVSPSPDSPASSSSSHTWITEEQAVSNARSSPSSSSSSAEPSESAFDALSGTSPVNELPDPKPVFNNWQEPPTKFRRVDVDTHEKKIKESLADSGLTEKQIDEYAKSAEYFPGVPSSEYQPRDLSHSCSPDRVSLSSSRSGPSTSNKATSPLASPQKTRDATSPERTPVAHVCKTPSRSPLEVDNLSPVFERLEVKSGKKSYGRAKLPDSPLLGSPLLASTRLSDGPESPSFSLVQLHEPTNSFSPKATSTTGLYEQATVATQTSLDQSTKCFSPKSISTTGLEDQDTVISVVSVCTQTPLYQPTEPIVLLIPEELSIAEQFAQAFDAEIVVGEWQDRATHVIFYLCNKTVNTRAILREKFLLKLSWLEDSLKAGLLLRPDDYQASLDADSHVLPSRIVNNQSVVDLFTGYVFLCSKPFDRLGYDLLKTLLIYHGATIIAKPSEFANHADKIAICLVGDDRCYNNIHMMSLMRTKLEKHCLVKVKYHWAISSLEAGSLRSIKIFLFDTSVEVAKSAGIPENLLS